jgi:hypothetical protein
MGKTAYSGPVYGAKATLFSFGPINAATSTVLGGVVVPAGEDWYATELCVFRNSTGSTTAIVSALDDSSVVGATAAITSSLTSVSSIKILPTDGGEYEGTRIASGSTVTFTVSDTNLGLLVSLSGYRRFINSTRGE